MAWCRLRVLLTAAEVVVVVGDDSEEYWNEVFSASFGVVSEVDVVSNPNEVSGKEVVPFGSGEVAAVVDKQDLGHTWVQGRPVSQGYSGSSIGCRSGIRSSVRWWFQKGSQ